MPMPTQYIDVVAGIIFNHDKSQVLLALRKPEQHQGNRWEFPGGKVEASEELEPALHRELIEELGIRVEACKPFCQIEHTYSDKAVRLHFWQVDAFSGDARGRENQKLQWFDMTELAALDFPEANMPVVTQLLELEI